MHLSILARSRTGRLLLIAVLLLLVRCDTAAPPPWQNRAPYPPAVSGPDKAEVGQRVSFDVAVFDPDGHALVVYVAWGDGDTSDYGGFVPSGETVTFEHAWWVADTFPVSAGCYDTYSPQKPLFSDWSDPHPVVVR